MAFANITARSELSDKDHSELVRYYKYYQDRLLQVTAKNRSVLLRRIYNKHNFDVAQTEEFKEGTIHRITSKVLKNIRSVLNSHVSATTSTSLLLDSIQSEEADSARARLKSLSRHLSYIEEETGQQAGYIGFPFLEGHVTSDFYVRGPLVLFPISLERRRTRKGWFIKLANKRPILNGALIASLKKKGEYSLPEDYEESFDEMIEDIANASDESEGHFFVRICQWIEKIVPMDTSKNSIKTEQIQVLNKNSIDQMERQKLHLINYKIIGNFPQADNQIYKDYNNLIKDRNRRWPGVVGSLFGMEVGGKEIKYSNESDEADGNTPKYLDSISDYQINTVLKSDSSQDEIIVRSKNSELLVVRGPPGTGKSQVIVNLIADALSSNKKILVVCQKRAALEVVRQRLEEVDLGKYVVFLAKEIDDRTVMYRQLYDIIMQEPSKSISKNDVKEISQNIDSHIKYLSELGVALRKNHFDGATAHKIYSKANGNYQPVLNLSLLGSEITWQNIDEVMEKINNIEKLFKKLENISHPWFGRKDFSKFGLVEKNRLDALLQELISLHPKCILTDSLLLQEQLERCFDQYAHHSVFLKQSGADFSGVELTEMDKLDALLQELISLHPKCILTDSLLLQEQLERCFDQYAHHSVFLKQSGADFSGVELTEMDKLDALLQELISLHPKCILTDSLLLQEQLERCFDGYLRNTGWLKRGKRKMYALGIKNILNVENINVDFVNKNSDMVKKGREFWKKMSKLLQYFGNSSRKRLERKISKHKYTISALHEIKNCLEAYTLQDTTAAEIKSILNVEDINVGFVNGNRGRAKKGREFWKKMSELLEYFDGNDREKLEHNMKNHKAAILILKGLKESLRIYKLRHNTADEIRGILNVVDINTNFVSGNHRMVKKGSEFWKKMSELLEYFNADGQKRIMLEANSNKTIISVLIQMKHSLDIDELQYFDGKKTEYKKDIMQILEQAKDCMKPDDNWTERIKEEIYFHWLAQIEQKNPILKGHHVDEYTNKSRDLAKSMEKKRQIVKESIQFEIESTIYPYKMYNRRSWDSKIWRDFANELQKKRRVKPVRKMFENYASQMFKVAPCWLASPESVSKVFPMQRNLFDLVIVDEASQLAVERAIPFLYRANRVVIAGDEKQLQPFDLFQIIEDDDDEDVPEEKSLLELARTRFRTFSLLWHYRSKYQDLINFSNQAFYAGMLNVAPGVDRNPKNPPIRWISCNGRWENNTNHEEARVVVKELKSIWMKNFELTGDYPSVGVITFNEPQQDLIKDEVDKALEADPEFMEMSNAVRSKKKDSWLFVKNIENVQGDERDIIVFSIGYAHDADGMFAQIFGSLNKKGGENRLNVAVTRARQEMIVICSIKPTDISPTSRNYGPRRLRQFLQYAKAVASQDKETQNAVLNEINTVMGRSNRSRVQEFDSDFEVQVFKGLERRGYQIDTQVGYSGYAIDLAVLHPNDPQRYIIGLECDGATFHSARSVKERDVMRQEFLESKGWKIERIWSRNWWKNSERELARIDGIIKNILSKESGSHQRSEKYEEAMGMESGSDAYSDNGNSLQELGRHEEAIECFDKAIELEPEDDSAYNSKGDSLQELGRHEEAIECFDKAIGLKPEDGLAYYYRGISLRALKRYEEAIECFDKAIELEPEDDSAYNSKGDSLQELGRHEEAIECFDKAIGLKPEDGLAYYYRGISLRALKRYEEAIECFDKAIELEPEDDSAYNSKGDSLQELGRHEEAIECFDKAIGLKPEDGLAYYYRGISLRALKRYEEAIECFDKAIELEPEDDSAYNSKGDSLQELGRHEEAIECFDKAIGLKPEDGLAYYYRGISLRALKRYEEAIECFDKAIELEPEDDSAYNSKGDSLQELGRHEEAIECFDKAIELRGDPQ